MWTDKERGIAKQLLEPDVLAFIEKVFVKVSVAGGKDLKEVLKKNVVALSNEEYESCVPNRRREQAPYQPHQASSTRA